MENVKGLIIKEVEKLKKRKKNQNESLEMIERNVVSAKNNLAEINAELEEYKLAWELITADETKNYANEGIDMDEDLSDLDAMIEEKYNGG